MNFTPFGFLFAILLPERTCYDATTTQTTINLFFTPRFPLLLNFYKKSIKKLIKPILNAFHDETTTDRREQKQKTWQATKEVKRGAGDQN